MVARGRVQSSIATILLFTLCCIGIAVDSSFLHLAGPAPYGWQTESDVTIEARIVNDIIEMYESTTLKEKKKWYEQGHGIDGELTLMSLGTNATKYSAYDPLFNIYVDAFADIGTHVETEDDGVFDQYPVEQYAHAIVDDILSLGSTSDGIETEAILVTGLWMRVYHYLYENLRLCHNNHDTRGMLRNIDKAAALWIGDKQTYGSNTLGVLLYNLAERTSVEFGQDAGISNVNSEFLSILSRMRQTIDSDECSSKSDTNNVGYDKLHQYVAEALRQMNILLVQRTIHFMETDIDKKYTKLYVLLVIPQIRACSTSDYQYFLNNVILKKSQTTESLTIARLQKMYSCLGVTCEDIGAYSGNRVPQCTASYIEPNSPLASYFPASDVLRYSKMDRDILQIKILLRYGNIRAAKDLYEKGRNMVITDSTGYSTPSSLQYLASGMDTFKFVDDKSRLYHMFEDYYDNPAYANKLVLEAFESSGKLAGKLAAIPTLLQTIVAPHFAIRAFFEAVDLCKNNSERASSVFDQGVAVLVGSNEGQGKGGSEAGVSWFSIAKAYCLEFNCGNIQDPPVNKFVMQLLLDGQNFIGDGRCDDLEDHVEEIESLLLIPIIQGLLFHVEMLRLSPFTATSDYSSHYAFVQAFSQAIIPVVSKVSKIQAHIIKESISISGETIDSTQVWTAIGRILDDGTSTTDIGITCEQIGSPNLIMTGKSFCKFVETIHYDPTSAPIRLIEKTESPTNTVSMSPSRADEDFRINRLLIEGRYTFTNITRAEEQAWIALDLRDIKQLMAVRGNINTKIEEARAIYSQGRNANSFNLQYFGISAPTTMSGDAYYNFYRQAFRNEEIFTDYRDTGVNVVDTFSDAVVLSALDQAVDLALAYESTVVLTMLMHIVHLLTTEVVNCKRNESLNGTLVDDAFALYLGVRQSKGKSDGHLLYSLVQKAEKTTDYSTNDEAKVNTLIITLFQQAKEQAKTCGTDDIIPFKLLRQTVGSIISSMNIPIVQFMEHYLTHVRDRHGDSATNAKNYVKLYALVILPQLAVCAPTAYSDLQLLILDDEIVAKDIDNIIKLLRKNYKCLGITCTDVHGDDNNCPDESTILAGFVPFKNVNMNSKIDQDILKILTLVRESALVAADDYYTFGDPLSPADPLYAPLQVLATSNLIKKSPFYDENTDVFMKDLLSQNPVESSLQGITAQDRAIVVSRTFQTMILLPAGLGSMMSAVETCKARESFDLVVKHWDRAAAFLIGSIEGDQRGGGSDNGLGIFGLVKEVCWEFSSCTKAGTAASNDKFVENLSLGEQLISASIANGDGRDCSTLEEFVTKEIVPILLVPVIQATLVAVFQHNRPSAFALTRSIIPIVNAIDPVRATIIDSETHLVDGNFNITLVADAFAKVIGQLGISCDEFMHWRNFQFDFCSSEDATSGRYVATTNVEEWGNIDLDVVNMIEAIQNKNSQMAKDFYSNGFNSHVRDKDGTNIGIRSIGGMSLHVNMVDEPVFNLYRYVLQDDNGSFLGTDVKYYAHSLVMSFFDVNDRSDISSTLPAEAAVVLNLWGNIVHKLHVTLKGCEDGSFQNGNGVEYIDQSAAYWIGSAQLTGNSSNGHLLYRLTEEVGKLFGQGLDGQTQNNRRVLQLFTEASMLLSFSDGCEGNTAAFQLRTIVNKIVAQMTVPLIQHLIFNLQANDTNRISLYGHAVVPLIAGCNVGTYNYLRERLINSHFLSKYTLNETIKHLQSTYACLGITCEDIGDLVGGGVPNCDKRQDLASFSGYTPRTNAQEYSDIDIDIRYMEIMLRMNAYSAAKDLYMLGKHAMVENGITTKPLSLQYLATALERKATPNFQLFNKYFNDQNYANSAIMAVFDEPIPSDIEGKSQDQKRAQIINTLRFMVTPMAAMQKFYESLESCTIVSKISNRRWDEGAALLIGSMGGSEDMGSGDGYLIYSLADDLCLKFGVCGTRGYAQVNALIREALYAGSTSLSDQSCTNVLYSVQTIESQIIVPLIQASLLSAVENSKLGGYTDAESIASAHVYSCSVLPYFQDQSVPTTVISNNLKFNIGKPPVEDGWRRVFHAFETAVDNMENVDCRDIGYLDMVDAGICSNNGAANGTALLTAKLCTVLFVAFTFLTAFNFLIQ